MRRFVDARELTPNSAELPLKSNIRLEDMLSRRHTEWSKLIHYNDHTGLDEQ